MSEHIQKQVLRKAIDQPIFSKDILPIVPTSAFEGNEVYKELSTVIQRYYRTNRNLLTENTFLTLMEEKLDTMKKSADDQEKYYRAIRELYNVKDYNDNEVIDEKVEDYIRKEMQTEVLKKAALNINNRDYMDSIHKEFQEISFLDISGKDSEIVNVIDDVEMKRLAFQSLNVSTVPTGFSELDYLNGGGLAKGELGMIVSISGGGKTMFTVNIASSYVQNGYNVLFIALEELQDRMLMRFEQAMLRQNKSSIVDSSGALNETRFNQLQGIYQKYRNSFGNLFLARYSPRTITPAKIEQLIQDTIMRQEKDIDVVVIDYPELLRNPNATGNESEDGGKLFEEMRRIGQDFNVVMWTAAQMNRTAYSAEIRTSEHMEGSIRKKNAAELVLTINQKPEEYNAGFIRLYADKVRNPPAGAFNRMLGFKVIGSAMTIRDYKDDRERNEHKEILEEIDNNTKEFFQAKSQKKKDNTPMPDFSSEINNAIQNNRN